MRHGFAAAFGAALAWGAAASADIDLFGNARLGLGYNVLNDGEPAYRTTQTQDGVVTARAGADDVRAISRIRFGVSMSGESDGGVAFGASIRADTASAGEGGTAGQTEGSVYASGDRGSLAYGDVDGADRHRVGDAVGNVSLTGLGDFNETPFLSNGGGSDNNQLQFITDPDARPTVRYDYDFGAFGVSASTVRALDDVAVGANYAFETERWSVAAAVGYYDFEAFTGTFGEYGEIDVAGGDQWAASLDGEFGAFQAGVAYTEIDAGSAGAIDVLNVGGGVTLKAWTVLAYYAKVLEGTDLVGGSLDGSDSYGASAQYDLGGGAVVAMGVARSFGLGAIGTPGDAQYEPEADAITMAEFGVAFSF